MLQFCFTFSHFEDAGVTKIIRRWTKTKFSRTKHVNGSLHTPTILKPKAFHTPIKSSWHGPATSYPGLGSTLPHLHWAHPCHICTGTGLTPATSAPGLGSPLPRDWPPLHTTQAERSHSRLRQTRTPTIRSVSNRAASTSRRPAIDGPCRTSTCRYGGFQPPAPTADALQRESAVRK